MSTLLPSQLAESMLLSLALDLRRVELMLKGGPVARESLSVGMYFVLKFLAHLAPQTDPDQLEVSEDRLFRALQILAISIEREIVTRIVGVSDEGGDDYLLNSLRLLEE